MAKDDLTSIMTEYPYMPLRDVVFHTLRRAIMQGDLKPGERLMEIKLANRLGVSRTPIREAIRMLELEGLVTMVPRKGAQVAEITEKDLKDVVEKETWSYCKYGFYCRIGCWWWWSSLYSGKAWNYWIH